MNEILECDCFLLSEYLSLSCAFPPSKELLLSKLLYVKSSLITSFTWVWFWKAKRQMMLRHHSKSHWVTALENQSHRYVATLVAESNPSCLEPQFLEDNSLNAVVYWTLNPGASCKQAWNKNQIGLQDHWKITTIRPWSYQVVLSLPWTSLFLYGWKSEIQIDSQDSQCISTSFSMSCFTISNFLSTLAA